MTCRKPSYCECDACYAELFAGEPDSWPRRPRLPRGLDKLSRAERKRVRDDYARRRRLYDELRSPPRPSGKVFGPADDPRREKLIKRYIPLAGSIARRHGYGGSDLVDCLAAALRGLVEAARSYDLGSGTPFGVYARKRVEGAVRDAVRREARNRAAKRTIKERGSRAPAARRDD